ncbi:hypothetical protein LI90_1375 [Carbonactinospora thermoautotrophica]|uniref:Uncharacterized protein n=1 Tax=Carbonactinospora thermoautotrophica TaxID=1469144 RepID=A0A132MPD9_9ACTN|nr:hypothetical protein LI90_1375 [Carbonactinospora thermoautotrophica]
MVPHPPVGQVPSPDESHDATAAAPLFQRPLVAAHRRSQLTRAPRDSKTHFGLVAPMVVTRLTMGGQNRNGSREWASSSAGRRGHGAGQAGTPCLPGERAARQIVRIPPIAATRTASR